MDGDRGLERARLGSVTGTAAGALIALVIFAGSLVLWIGIPLGWVWLASRLADRWEEVYGAALIGCPVTMALFGLVLGRLNAIHLRVTGGHVARGGTAWLKSLSGDRVSRQPRTVLDTSMVVSVVIAIVALTVWYFFFAHSYTPGLPAP